MTKDGETRGRGAMWIGLTLVIAAGVLYTGARLTGFGARLFLFGGALAFPVMVYALLLAIGCALAIVAVARRSASRRPLVVSIGSVLLLCVALGVQIITTPVTTTPAELDIGPRDGTLRVVSWNVAQDAVTPAHRAELIAATDPDIVAFLELYDVRALREGLPDGYQLLADPDIAISLLVSDDLGDYQVTRSDTSGTTSGIVATPVDPASMSPRIVAVHLVRMGLSSGTEYWERGLQWVAESCNAENTIALGDFNADLVNMPNGQLGMCSSVGDLAPSWPTSWPRVLGASIDHVLATPDYGASRAVTLQLPENTSDHRPVLADLTRSR